MVVRFAFICPGESGEGIWWDVGFPWDVKDFIVVFLKIRVPSCCSSIEVSRRFPVLKVCMVCHDGEGVFRPS